MAKSEAREKLTKDSEEYKMLIDVTKEYPNQTGSPHQKSGKATQIVIHNHLSKDISLPQNLKIEIQEVKTRMNLLYLLKTGVDQNRKDYSVDELDAVLKIVNNAVGKNYRDKIKDTFEKFRQANPKLHFAVIVLSENSVENPYIHRLKQEYFGSSVEYFELINRTRSAQELYLEETVTQLLNKGLLLKPNKKGWNDLINWLKGK